MTRWLLPPLLWPLLFELMMSSPSRYHSIVGAGMPSAEHLSVTGSLRATVMSVGIQLVMELNKKYTRQEKNPSEAKDQPIDLTKETELQQTVYITKVKHLLWHSTIHTTTLDDEPSPFHCTPPIYTTCMCVATPMSSSISQSPPPLSRRCETAVYSIVP
ncbi:hypothetical protein OUZ56_029498 [Daphnia magna]|uniref:Uncharacterized protein n=1 Tax=Daphnia magna TaxID=35525 RepID=A0ABR0B6Z5_9CRUS|nr:hypothetical protein OUZ56_029498 [Daphnia magna]